ncbi:MAG: DUF885 domain-containing protein [Chitinophagales bacterium]
MNKFHIGCFLAIILLFTSINKTDAQTILFGPGKKGGMKTNSDGINMRQMGGIKKSDGMSQKFSSFEEYKDYFFKTYWSLNPEYAAYLGLSDYDTQMTILGQSERESSEKTYLQLLKELQALEGIRQFSNEDKTDYALIKNELESALWYSQTFRSFEWNPSVYNIGGSFDRLVSDDEISASKRIAKLYEKMQHVPAYYKAAITNIKDPTLEHTQLAVYRIGGTLDVFNTKIKNLAKEAKPEDWEKISKENFYQRLEEAITSIEMFDSYLNKKLLPALENFPDVRSFRIGKELYDEKFKFDIQSGYSASELYDIAVKEKVAIHQKMFGIADKLWSKYFPSTNAPEDKLMKVEMLIDIISQKHVKRGEFITSIEKQLPELVDFVKKKDLLYLDPSKPLEVRATPEYMRGTAGASISAPGPFDKDAATYYNVTPLDHYTDEQAESYLKEYNYYMLQILNIHEAIPGHYAQLVYANQSPSLVKSIFGNGAMIEGWACYAERMMLEEGYGDNAPEMWLMYYKWNLRIVCNTILDYSVHVLEMSQEDAMELLIHEAFQEQTEAEEKWRRAQLSQVQLCSYFAGLTEIYNFREEKKKELGADFNLKAFHEQFLSFGSAPVKEIRKLMANEKIRTEDDGR